MVQVTFNEKRYQTKNISLRTINEKIAENNVNNKMKKPALMQLEFSVQSHLELFVRYGQDRRSLLFQRRLATAVFLHHGNHFHSLLQCCLAKPTGNLQRHLFGDIDLKLSNIINISICLNFKVRQSKILIASSAYILFTFYQHLSNINI